LWSLVSLWDLVAIPSLLILHGGTWGLPLETHIGTVTKLTTLEASSVGEVRGCSDSHWCTHWSSLLILRKSGARCLRSRLLERLSGTRGLLLPKVSTRSSIAERHVLRWSEARTSDTPKPSLAGGLPLLFSQLSTLVLQANSTVYQTLECWEDV
jgi:hypothetical protein